MDKRPKVLIPITKVEVVLNTISIFLLAYTFFNLYYVWNDLPEKMPAHFNAAGKVDRWGGKGSALTLPIVGSLMFIMLLVISKYPHVFNYPVRVTNENAKRLYLEGKRLMVILNFELVLFFSIGSWETVKSALEKATLSSWYIPLLLITIFGTLAISIYRMVRMK